MYLGRLGPLTLGTALVLRERTSGSAIQRSNPSLADHPPLPPPADITGRAVLVVGLGRFGNSLASTLNSLGSEVLAEVRAPKLFVGRALVDIGLRSTYRVTVVCVKPEGASFTYAESSTMVHEGDLLVLAGTPNDVEAVAALP